jgi:hypothetical protein
MVSHDENENEGGCALQHDAVAEPELAEPWGKADYTIKVRREGRNGGRRREGGNISPSVQALVCIFFLLFSFLPPFHRASSVIITSSPTAPPPTASRS